LNEAVIVREIFHLLIEEGYGTNRVANYLNERGIKTRRGTNLWRATSVQALMSLAGVFFAGLSGYATNHHFQKAVLCGTLIVARNMAVRGLSEAIYL